MTGAAILLNDMADLSFSCVRKGGGGSALLCQKQGREKRDINGSAHFGLSASAAVPAICNCI